MDNQQIFISYHDIMAKLDLEDTENLNEEKTTLPVSLRRCFDNAIYSKSPSSVYRPASNRFRIGHVQWLACIPSIGWREYFIQKKYKHNIAKILKIWLQLLTKKSNIRIQEEREFSTEFVYTLKY